VKKTKEARLSPLRLTFRWAALQDEATDAGNFPPNSRPSSPFKISPQSGCEPDPTYWATNATELSARNYPSC